MDRMVLAMGALVLPMLSCGGPGRSAKPEPKATPAPRYVGSDACARCHSEVTARWRGSHHDRAMDAATDATVRGDFDDATFLYAGTTTRFFRRDGAFMVETDGPDGRLAEYRIAHTFGTEPLQQYLIEFPRGRVQALNVCWDDRPCAEGGQRWFHLYPHEEIRHDDPLHWTGRMQNWNHMCAECHSTALVKGYDADRDAFDTRYQEIDVGCESCHGPGSAHTAWAEALSEGSAVDPSRPNGLTLRLTEHDGGLWEIDPAIGMAKRHPTRRNRQELRVCAPCHSRRTPLEDGFQLGRPLLDSHRPALLSEGLYEADGQIKDEVYVYGSFLQSRMYAAGVTCSDCHDPHDLTLHGQGNAVCAQCHLVTRFDTPAHHHHPPGSDGASCVSCHMPVRTYMVIDPRHDHSFRVPRPDLTLRIDTPNACNDCHPDRPAEWAASAADRWWGPERAPHYGEALYAARRREVNAIGPLEALVRNQTQPAIVRATAVSLLAPWPPSRTRTSIAAALADPDDIVRLAALELAEGLPPADRLRLVSPLLDDPRRANRFAAARILSALPSGQIAPATSTRLASVISRYRAGLRANADRPEALLNLGALAANRNEYEAAESAYLSALDLAPDFAPAAVNLADLYRHQSREDDGEAVLRRALAVAPNRPDLHHSLGLVLERQGRRDDAIRELRQAAALDPDDPRHAYVLAIALHSSGQTDPALEILRRCHERFPTHADTLLALITINRDRGDRAAALSYARRLASLVPSDSNVAALINDLSRS